MKRCETHVSLWKGCSPDNALSSAEYSGAALFASWFWTLYGNRAFSFTDATGVPGQTWNFIGFENYTTFFTSSDSGDRIASIGRSLYFAVAVVVIQNAVGLFMAILINKKLKGDVLYRSVFFLPVVLGVTVSGLIWQLLANPLGGPAQALLNFLEPAPTSLGIMILHLNWSFLCKFGCTWVTR